jgi:hypothetical protein
VTHSKRKGSYEANVLTRRQRGKKQFKMQEKKSLSDGDVISAGRFKENLGPKCKNPFGGHTYAESPTDNADTEHKILNTASLFVAS